MITANRNTNDTTAKWFTQFMNTCVIFRSDGLMHGVDIDKTSQLCRDDPSGAIAALKIFGDMLNDDSRKDKGAEMMAGGVFVSYLLMRHQQSGLPIEDLSVSELPPELVELKEKMPKLEAAVKYALEKIR